MESNPAKKISVVVILVGLFLCLNMAAFPGDADVPKGGAVSNDNCENAIPVSVDEEVRGTTIGATGDLKSDCGREDYADVWHMFTPESDGVYKISLCGSDFDTTLSVFTGSCAVLEEISCNDDGGSCGSGHWGASELVIELTENIP
ncbi:MAG TPA: hypothetical protein PK480_03510, partial [Candidatus Hydrogenedentes bacterium]|nr:hypothetical protein [Candidatus Hydrogenedentota bacterium]